MSLKDQISADIKDAMRAKAKEKLLALRAVKSMILLAETSEGADGELSKEEEKNILMKAAKQRKQSIDVFHQQGRDDLADKERSELDVIQQYLPQPLSEETLKAELQKIIASVNATGMQDMGKVMSAAKASLGTKADGQMMARLVKTLLAQG